MEVNHFVKLLLRLLATFEDGRFFFFFPSIHVHSSQSNHIGTGENNS